ncbi:MAG: magnesium/cobalt transporter CorA [Kiritimatiellaceae bacterium]|nr:magnesium/cobalt transporter CorA [Kiritimatiellaceae bacterium]
MKHKSRLKRAPRPPGMPPGTLILDPSWPKPVIQVIAYSPDQFMETVINDVRDLDALIGRHRVLWINVDGMGDESVLRYIGKLFNLHPLALEDVTSFRQRSKVDDYTTTLYTAMKMLSIENNHLIAEQISFFLGPNFVLTFQEIEGDCLNPVRDRIRNKGGMVCNMNADYLLYCLIDAIIDAYFPVLEHYALKLDSMEEQILDHPDASVTSPLFSIKRDLTSLRRTLWPVREMTNALVHSESTLISPTTHVYLRDCQDHAVQLLELAESYRETGSSLMDLYLSSISTRMNEIMKVLTIISTIFIPLTFIAGIYGMNFKHMPELQTDHGYFVIVGIMLFLGLGMFGWFIHKGWLSSGANRRSGQENNPT